MQMIQAQILTVFQYPRADRGECNKHRDSRTMERFVGTFSILVQIVGSATFIHFFILVFK